MTNAPDDKWLTGDAYEAYMGRWSRPLAREFVAWLDPQPAAHWLEIGCGTGALTTTIRDFCEPASVVASDPSEAFIEHARKRLADPHISFIAAADDALPRREGGFDVAVSGLVFNLLRDPRATVKSILERLRSGGTIAAYVWDYAEGMEFLRVFWDEAAVVDPRAVALDEATRFPLCQPSALASLFHTTGLTGVETHVLDIATDFASFDDYWLPFLGGTGPAPGYVASLDPDRRELLRQRLQRRLRTESDGRIQLRASAWAVRGVSP